jgi:hypothetical protein
MTVRGPDGNRIGTKVPRSPCRTVVNAKPQGLPETRAVATARTNLGAETLSDVVAATQRQRSQAAVDISTYEATLIRRPRQVRLECVGSSTQNMDHAGWVQNHRSRICATPSSW